MNKKLAQIGAQAGLSLIELLIAMTIGLFLLSGIATSYMTSVKSSSNRDQSSMLEDNGRLALETITNSLKHAGYSSGQNITDRFINNKAQIIQENCGGSINNVQNTSIFPTNSTVDNAGGDSITAVYYGDNRLNTDCSGGVLLPSCRLESGDPDNARIYNAFYLEKDTNDSLICAGSLDSNKQVVAEGIENIQILYGVDTGGTGSQQDRFVDATELFAAGNNLLSSVVSIQVAVLVRSLLPVNTKAEIKKFMLLGTEYTSPNDRFRREVFTTTIRLRNTL